MTTHACKSRTGLILGSGGVPNHDEHGQKYESPEHDISSCYIQQSSSIIEYIHLFAKCSVHYAATTPPKPPSRDSFYTQVQASQRAPSNPDQTPTRRAFARPGKTKPVSFWAQVPPGRAKKRRTAARKSLPGQPLPTCRRAGKGSQQNRTFVDTQDGPNSV